nr:protein Rf1, mitochondrial-like [Lolium perenne]
MALVAWGLDPPLPVDVLLHRMPDLGCVPDAFSRNTVLKGLCDDRRSEKPDIVTFNSLIDGYCLVSKMQKASRFQSMTAKPDTLTYGMVLDGLFKAGRIVGAKKMFREMIKSGVRFSIGTYNIILGGLCKNSCGNEAIMLFEKLQAMNLKFDIVTHIIIIDAIFNVGRIEQAKNLFAAIPAKGLAVDTEPDDDPFVRWEDSELEQILSD